jgi:hypothetical protein
VPPLQVACQLLLGGEGVGVEAGGGNVTLLVLPAQVGEQEPFGGVGGLA